MSSKSVNDGAEFTIDWDVRQYYLTVFTTTIPTEHKLPWLRDDHAYDMSIAWQNVGYNQPPHLSYNLAERMAGTEQTVSVTLSSVGVSTYSNTAAVDFSDADGLTIYVANLNTEETEVTLTELTSKVIPAATPVILQGTAGTTYYGQFTTTDATIETNMQAAEYMRTVADGDQILALGAKDGQPVFAKMAAGSTLKAHTGFFEYVLPATANSRIAVVFDGTTGIKGIDDLTIYDLRFKI